MLPRHPRLQTSYPSVIPLSAPFPPSYISGYSSTPPAPSSSLSHSGFFDGTPKVLARSTELLHCISLHLVNLICIQESNLDSSSFRIPGYSAMRSNRTHSRPGILSPDDPHASGGDIISFRQGLSFSELSTSYIFSLDPYSDYIEDSISTPPCPLSSTFMLPLFALFLWIEKPTPSPPLLFSFIEIFSFWKISIAIIFSGTQKTHLTPVGMKYSIGLSLWTSFPSMTPSLLLFSIPLS